ncbi:MAG: transporter permease subunit [Conexibacter sp.]|nr:transporter permease subunit [Conexibacter sp.]
MSTAVATATDRPNLHTTAPRGRVTQLNVVRSEWTKLWTLRSTRWSLLAAVVAMAGLGILVAAVQMSRWTHLDPHERAVYDSIDTGVGGYHLAQLAIGVLGVLVISGEYSTGMIRSSFMAVPKRLPVLWAKLGVFSAVTFVLMLISSFVSFFAVQAIVRQHHQQHALSDPHALRAVVGTALFLTVLGALSVGIGGLVRNTAGGIALFVFLLFVLPGITGILPASVADSVNPYLPLNAGFAVTTSTFENSHHLAPWTGFALFCGYAALAVGAAAIGLLRRDA